MNKFLYQGIGYLLIMTVCLCSCQKEDGYYNYKTEVNAFDGNVIEYLRSRNGEYDSMLAVISRIPGMRDSLLKNPVTLFAVSNKSFTLALQGLNKERAMEDSVPLYISDLDSSKLDSIICRYVFKGLYTTDSIAVYSQGIMIPSYKYGYNMHLQYSVSGASGYMREGTQILTLSDMNNTTFSNSWDNAETKAVNIRAQHAIIHILVPSHEFGFSKFARTFDQ